MAEEYEISKEIECRDDSLKIFLFDRDLGFIAWRRHESFVSPDGPSEPPILLYEQILRESWNPPIPYSKITGIRVGWPSGAVTSIHSEWVSMDNNHR
jgi:hypothetical protein